MSESRPKTASLGRRLVAGFVAGLVWLISLVVASVVGTFIFSFIAVASGWLVGFIFAHTFLGPVFVAGLHSLGIGSVNVSDLPATFAAIFVVASLFRQSPTSAQK